MADRPDISIIGAGKVGTALGVLAARAGYRVVAVADVSEQAARAAAEMIAGARASSVREAASAGNLVLLTVPDDVIEPLCMDLARSGSFTEGAVVAHCSGALASDALASAAPRNPVGSMHPLQTFPTAQAAIDAMPGVCFFCEGDQDALQVLEELAVAIGGRPVRIASGAKPLYHAAAVVACNYLVSLLDAAWKIAARAGIDQQTAGLAFGPLIRSTVENVLAMGPKAALTGPFARGDLETLRRHLAALEGMEQRFHVLYTVLGGYTVELALEKGTIDGVAAAGLLAALIAPSAAAPPAAPRRSARPRGPKHKPRKKEK